MSTTVVCFGELLLRLSPPGDARLLQSPLLEWFAGGSEANVAAQLAQLGGSVRYITRVPSHAIGERALEAVRALGVDCHAVLRGGTRLGTYYLERGAGHRPLSVIYDRAGSAFSDLTPDAVAWPTLLADAGWLHSSGITAAVGDGPAACLASGLHTARAQGVRCSVDLNWRPAIWGARDPRAVMPSLVDGLDLLVGNPAACAAMLGMSAPTDDAAGHVALAHAVRRRFRIDTVAITHRVVESPRRHHWSALAVGGPDDAVVSSPVWTVDVVDRVGGGDAFVGALLAELAHGRPLTTALPFAVAASALKLTVPGDMNRVRRDEIDAACRATSARA